MDNVSTPYYKALDLVLITLACSIAYWFRFDTIGMPIEYFLPTTILSISATFSLSITTFYREVNSESSLQQTYSAVSGILIAAVITITCLYFTKTGSDFSRIWLATSSVLSLFTVITSRYIFKQVFNMSGGNKVIVLLGSNSSCNATFQTLSKQKNKQLYVAEKFKFDENHQQESLEAAAKFIEEYRKNNFKKAPVSEIWITHSAYKFLEHNQLEAFFLDSAINIVYIPELPTNVQTGNPKIEFVYDIPTIYSNVTKIEKRKLIIKFIVDQLIAWSALTLLSPILIISALLIKFDSPGPVFFRQKRYGLGGKSFNIWKFRTMTASETDNKFKQAMKNDPRITKIGNFLRKSSIDELPQLFNVITGTMSIVGPRPHPNLLNEQYRSRISRYMRRHNVKPGITGLAQIRGARGETATKKDMQKRIDYDLIYIKNESLCLDLKILYKTFFTVIRGTGG